MMEAMEASNSNTGSPVSTRSRSSLSSQSDNMAKRAARNSRVHFDEEGDGNGLLVSQQESSEEIEEHPIIVQVIGEEVGKVVGVYLGFLQEVHKYEVRFTIPLEMCEGYLSPPPIKSSSSKTSPNPEENASSISGLAKGVKSIEDKCEYAHVIIKGEYCEVSKMFWTTSRGVKKMLQVVMEVRIPSVASVRFFQDSFTIHGGDCCKETCTVLEKDVNPDRFVRINVSAKVMGKTMGTPTLKDGIKCTGLCPDPNASDSSSSDSDHDNRKGKQKKKEPIHL